MSGQNTIIFDFDGTLANTVDLAIRLYNNHSEEFGYSKVNRAEFPDLRRMGYKKAMKNKGVHYRVIPKMLLKITREMKNHMEEVRPYDGVVDVLIDIRKSGYSIGVLTSNNGSLVKEFFERHEFPEFDFVVSEKTYFGKEKALKRIMKSFDLDRNQILYVGDEPRDVSACRKAKIQVVGVTWGIGGVEGFEHSPPDYLVSSPGELTKAISEFAQE